VPQSRSGRGCEEKNSQPPQGLDTPNHPVESSGNISNNLTVKQLIASFRGYTK